MTTTQNTPKETIPAHIELHIRKECDRARNQALAILAFIAGVCTIAGTIGISGSVQSYINERMQDSEFTKLIGKGREHLAETKKVRQEANNTLVEIISIHEKAMKNPSGIKFFHAEARIETRTRQTVTELVFPERVDFVSIESLINDGHLMHVAWLSRIDDKRFKVTFTGASDDPKMHWIPHVRYVGIQLQKPTGEQ